jgi:site-specific recombinase XerD
MTNILLLKEPSLQLHQYTQFMLENEYTKSTCDGYKTYLSRFLKWPSLKTQCTLFENINSFLKSEHQNHPKTLYQCRAALYLYFKMIEKAPPPIDSNSTKNSETETILSGFYDYSVNMKHMKKGTAESEVNHVRRFLTTLHTQSSSFDISKLTAADIRSFIMDDLSGLLPSSKGRMVTSIRNFFRYQKFKGFDVHNSILQIPLSPAVWKQSAFPTTLSDDVFNSLCNIPNTQTAVGKRDRAIILCFTELALRCIEVASLTIDDFDWYNGQVNICETKTNSDRKLPLSKTLGTAIIEYLRYARPKTDCRVLFVRYKHDCGKSMGREQIRGVVRRIYAKAGVDPKITGTHILRRTSATKIYNSGNSLKMTADILGHMSLDTTVQYTKADFSGLQTVAAQWPGGDSVAK